MSKFDQMCNVPNAPYIKDSEPVVDGSRNQWCAVQWANRNKLTVQTKLNNQSNKKQLKSAHSTNFSLIHKQY